MSPRQHLENLPVGRKLLVALLLLLAAILLVANLAFVSAAYWITQQTVAPQALNSLSQLMSVPAVSHEALSSTHTARELLSRLSGYEPLRAAAIYDQQGRLLVQQQRGAQLTLPAQVSKVAAWQNRELRTSLLTELPQPEGPPGHLLLIASSQLPSAFYTGTLTASAVILVLSVLFWLLIARQIRRLITQPIRDLEAISRQVTREENYALRAARGHADEIGSLAEAFNTMLTRVQANEQQLRKARDDAQQASEQARLLTEQTRQSNRRLEIEIQVRSKIEKKLTGFQNYLNSIIDSMPSALIALDDELFVTQWNQEATRLSGTPLDQALNQPVMHAFAPLKPFLPQLRRAAQQQQVEKIERVSWKINGETRQFALTLYPLMGGTGKGLVVRIDDISQRLAMEELMVQSEKMLSVGGLAAGMAHEINNPLGAILHNVQNIRRRISTELPKNLEVAQQLELSLQQLQSYWEQRDIPRLLDDIQHAGNRAAKIVSHMLSFSRISNKQLIPCDLKHIIAQSLEIAGSDFGLEEDDLFSQLIIDTQYDPRLPDVPCIPNELEQVLLNLLKNAVQAIQARETQTPSGHIQIHTQFNPPWAEIHVHDNGAGIQANIRTRIFEPFFTTKEVGQGTGLGLSVSYFIITSHHLGQMEVKSTPKQGTTFIIRLPLNPPSELEPSEF